MRLALKREPPADRDADTLAQARLDTARRLAAWTELQEADLEQHGRWLVHVATDEILRPYRGRVWGAGTATPIPDQAPLRFVVSDDRSLRFYERVPGRTWSALQERQAS